MVWTRKILPLIILPHKCHFTSNNSGFVFRLYCSHKCRHEMALISFFNLKSANPTSFKNSQSYTFHASVYNLLMSSCIYCETRLCSPHNQTSQSFPSLVLWFQIMRSKRVASTRSHEQKCEFINTEGDIVTPQL